MKFEVYKIESSMQRVIGEGIEDVGARVGGWVLR